MKGWSNIQKFIGNHISRLKRKNYDYLQRNRKPFYKIPSFVGRRKKKKTSQKLKIKRNFLNMINCILKKKSSGNSLVVQWLGLPAFTAKGAGSISGPRAKIPKTVQHGRKKKPWANNMLNSKWLHGFPLQLRTK